MDRTTLQAWLDRYVEAWKSYDPEEIGALFGEAATYRYHPYDADDDVVRGRDAIVGDWIRPEGSASTRDKPGTYDAHYEPYAIDGDRAVAVGTSSYWTDGSRTKLERIYYNAFLLRFDDDGKCVEFTEYFLKAPDPTA